MDILEGFRIAVWSLVANPLRSFLTLLGVIIGVTAIISVVAVINGLNIYVQEKMITLGPGSFEVNRFGIITNRKQFLEAIRKNRVLRLSDAEAVRERCELAERVAVKVYGDADVRYRGQLVSSVTMKGINHQIMLVESYEIQAGRIISEDDVDRATPVTFVGADVAEKLFGTVDPVGKEIKLQGKTFEVIGVGARRGSVFGQSRDNYVLIPITTFRKNFGTRNSVAIVVRTRDPRDVERAMDEVRVILRARHHIRYSDPDDFGFINAEALNRLWSEMSRTIFQVALFVVGISLVVGGIVIMNIMLVSVIERTREIGVRKAIGARHRDIRRQFLIESAVLAAAGGLTGVSIAYGVTWAVRSFSPLPAVFPWWAPALALSLSSAVGLFFGLYPAAKAAKLNPIEALRSE
jgi:putative ABC transport system permease protein